MGRVITVTSGKGGVGKTTATANIAAALALHGHKVVAIDTDIGLRNLDVVLGLENRIVYDVVDVIEGRCRLRQALIRDKRLPELFLMPASQTRDKDAVEPEQMVELCKELREQFDFILLDSPAGIEKGFRVALAPADQVLIITTPEVAAVRDADRVIGLVEAAEKGPALLVINRLKPGMVRRGDMLSPDDITEILAVDLIGLVPEDEAVVISTNRGQPLAIDGSHPAGQAFEAIALRLTGEDIPVTDLAPGGGLLSRILRFVREGGRTNLRP
ncbi:MAG: septum site-determining protein MinD [Anaerolineae bacterium]